MALIILILCVQNCTQSDEHIMCYGLEMVGRVFSVELCGCYPLFYYSLVLLVMRLQPIDNIQVFRNK